MNEFITQFSCAFLGGVVGYFVAQLIIYFCLKREQKKLTAPKSPLG